MQNDNRVLKNHILIIFVSENSEINASCVKNMSYAELPLLLTSSVQGFKASGKTLGITRVVCCLWSSSLHIDIKILSHESPFFLIFPSTRLPGCTLFPHLGIQGGRVKSRSQLSPVQYTEYVPALLYMYMR